MLKLMSGILARVFRKRARRRDRACKRCGATRLDVPVGTDCQCQTKLNPAELDGVLVESLRKELDAARKHLRQVTDISAAAAAQGQQQSLNEMRQRQQAIHELGRKQAQRRQQAMQAQQRQQFSPGIPSLSQVERAHVLGMLGLGPQQIAGDLASLQGLYGCGGKGLFG